MAGINIAQVLLIDTMQSKAWILALPAHFLVPLMGLAVGSFWCPTTPSAPSLWDKKSVLARCGTVLSIITPILLCQFV